MLRKVLPEMHENKLSELLIKVSSRLLCMNNPRLRHRTNKSFLQRVFDKLLYIDRNHPTTVRGRHCE
uniref:Uncharacterized protein n=1 Tax=Picea glauca TaxID=3330 RepID=A0A124GND4_PICGL|nr:hypothetical protein ABT39_MTgene4487 [Picea glauca]QHR87396.1 hypothetical protein Q903MT_gene1406 [Picea sitchensis]